MASQVDPRKFWGTPTWYVIHSLAYTLNPNQCNQFATMMSLLTKIIVCGACRNHLIQKFETSPPCPLTKVNNSKNAFKYTVILHNLVNISKEYPTHPYDYSKAAKVYMTTHQNKLAYGLWRMLLSFAYQYKDAADSDNTHFKEFVKVVVSLIPRSQLKTNLGKFISASNFDNVPNDRLFEWVFRARELCGMTPKNTTYTSSLRYYGRFFKSGKCSKCES